MTAQLSHSSRRSRQLWLAMIGSTFSKLSGLGLQVLSLPLVYRTLPTHDYGIFLLVSAVLATLSLTQLGAGPGLTQAIARAAATDDRRGEADAFAATLQLSFAIIAVAGAAMLVLVHIVPSSSLFGSGYTADQPSIQHVATIGVLLTCANVFFVNVDSALAGYQEQSLTYLGSLVANVAAGGALVWICRGPTTVVEVIVCLSAPQAACRLVNLVALVIRRPYLCSRFARTSRRTIATLLGPGLGFWTVSLCSIVEQNAGTFILGHVGGDAELATYGVVYRLIWLFASAMGIVTQPLWPALVDARERTDVEWIHRLLGRGRRVVLAGCAALVVGLVVLGPTLFPLCFHVTIGGDDRLMFTVFAVYLGLNIWTHFHYVSLMGLTGIWRIAFVIAIENALVVIVGIALAPWLGALGIAIAYLAASVVVPAWYLPRMLASVVRDLERAQSIPSSRA